MSSSDQSRMTFALAAVLLGLLGGAALFALILSRSGSGRESELVAHTPPAVPPPRDAPATLAGEGVRRGEEVRVAPTQAEPPASKPGVRCVQREDRAPLAGVSVYVDGKPVAGPSGIDGRIAYDRPRVEAFVVWAPGLRPAFVHAADPTPSEIALGDADAALAVEILNLGAEDEVQRTLLHPYAFPAEPGAPWAPVLREERFGGYGAEALPPGAYDVYVWIGGDDAAALRAERVLLKSGETTTVRLDAEQAVAGDPDG